MTQARSVYALILSIAIALSLPLFAHAQNADLQSTIRAALASDPRTAGMSQAQVDLMVSQLSNQAQAQGVTSDDITWRPVANRPGAANTGLSGGSDCTAPHLLCSMTEAFGFTGPDSVIAIWLGVAALLLIFMIGAVLEYEHFRHLHPAPAPKQ